MKKYRRGFAPILVLILIVVAVVGGYLFGTQSQKTNLPQSTTTPEPTSMLKYKLLLSGIKPEVKTENQADGSTLLTDLTFKYSIQFPGNYNSHAGNPNQMFNYDLETAPGREFNGELDKEEIKIEIWTSAYEGINSFEDFIKLKEDQSRQVGREPKTDYKETVIDGVRALEVIDDIGSNLHVYVLRFQNPITKYFHTISIYPRYDLHKVEVDQILSTFKFIE